MLQVIGPSANITIFDRDGRVGGRVEVCTHSLGILCFAHFMLCTNIDFVTISMGIQHFKVNDTLLEMGAAIFYTGKHDEGLQDPLHT